MLNTPIFLQIYPFFARFCTKSNKKCVQREGRGFRVQVSGSKIQVQSFRFKVSGYQELENWRIFSFNREELLIPKFIKN